MFEEPDAFEDENEGLPPRPKSFVPVAIIFYGVMGCIALVWRMRTPGASIFHPAGNEATLDGLGFAIGAGVLLGLAAVASSEWMTRATKLGEALADTLGESLVGLSTADAILLAIVSGTAEEMFFRGAVQPAVGLVWASVLFGACHFLPRKELALWSLWAVAMGAALGALFEWTGHLAAPIAAHIVINGVNLPRLARRAEERAAEAEAEAAAEADDDASDASEPPDALH